MFKLGMAGLALAALAGTAQAAVEPAEIDALRQEVAALRAAYEARLAALEARLKAAESAASAAPPPPPSAPTVTASANTFNPAISLILSGTTQRSSRDPADYRIAGFARTADAEIGPGSRGFNLGESELGLSANIDPWWHGAANIALHGDNAVSVEEAYVQTTALGHGLTLKAGRWLSGLGYLNEQHAHAWDFADAPLAYQALLGGQVGEDGLQLQWLAPTDHYLRLGLELGRGRAFPGDDAGRNGLGSVALTAHTGGDLGESHSWRFGASVLQAKARDQALVLPNEVEAAFSGRTRVWVLDGVWKWAPGGNATRTNFKLQGEYLRSRRDGEFADATVMPAQSGWYLQGVYQFMPAWRVGLRTERLQSGLGWQPRKTSAMLDWAPSEFSRLRLQFAADRARDDGTTDRQITLQYQMSLGAHGAHRY